ncbi:hypothetical protein [Streptomyces sp. STR69]|uniref:hypothetical protein n=1 Tax=Streptomyces sp. STR69 TaxID=1796942 RepID=UPI0021C8652E|nr:hypothetical protein [Streptomyces sp. STR69]
MAHPRRESVAVPHAVAVLSTTRGSGATLLTAAAGLLIDDAVGRVGQSVILMDADIDGGGLTTLTRSWNTTCAALDDGLLGFAGDDVELAGRDLARYLRHVHTGARRRQDMVLFPLGPGDKPGERLPTDGTLEEVVGTAVDRLVELGGCLIVDCGDSRTQVTLEVCHRVEHIILVGQLGPEGGEETGRLLSWLADRGLGAKVIGWVCNSPSAERSPTADPAGVGAPLMRLPYDTFAAATVAVGTLPDGTSPLLLTLCAQLRALWPDVLNDGGWGRDE